MARPKCQRRVGELPRVAYFKPRGVPMGKLEEVEISVDELEAIRLADYEGFYHERAASEMGVSRQTFGRIIQSARQKVAQSLLDGKAMRIEGGEFIMAEARIFECHDCRHRWEEPFGTGRPQKCPECESGNIGRAFDDRGFGRGRGCRRGRGRAQAGPRRREERT